MKSINIIGAFDRYNYGDLLFPILIEEYLKKYKKDIFLNYSLEYYALIESNLTEAKGKQTLALKDLYNKNLEEGSVILVSGGDVLPARIGNMDIDLCKSNFQTICQKATRKIIGTKSYEKKSKKKFELESSFPWVVSEKDMKNCKVAYNAVGGSTLKKLPSEDLKFIKNNMESSSYISVRENITEENLSEFQLVVSPDSATLMSDIYPIEVLERMVRTEVKQFVTFKKDFIIIQTNNSSLKNGQDKVLAKEIEKLKNENNIEVLMLPIGFAANHDDNIAIRKIGRKLNIEYSYFEFLDVYEVMYLIAKSKFFAGTSLHGNITAMAYSVYHIGLNKEIKKLDNYLKCWDIKGQDHCIDFSELSQEYKSITSIDKKKLEKKKVELIELVKKNYEDMFEKLGVN